MALLATTNNKQGKTVVRVRKREENEDTQTSSRPARISTAMGSKPSCKSARRMQGTSTLKDTKQHPALKHIYVPRELNSTWLTPHTPQS
jgi:hypothetical protein